MPGWLGGCVMSVSVARPWKGRAMDKILCYGSLGIAILMLLVFLLDLLAGTPVTISEPSRQAQFWRRVLRHKGLMIGTTVLVVIGLMALLAPLIAPYDPYSQDLLHRTVPPVWYAKGSWTHILGTDNLGRDYLSRVIYGARISLLIGLSVMVIPGECAGRVALLATCRQRSGMTHRPPRSREHGGRHAGASRLAPACLLQFPVPQDPPIDSAAGARAPHELLTTCTDQKAGVATTWQPRTTSRTAWFSTSTAAFGRWSSSST